MGRGLVKIVTEQYGETFNDLWSVAKQVKSAKCCLCDREIPRGDHSYRPITNRSNRSSRMCEEHCS
jgi:hypothetical protein